MLVVPALEDPVEDAPSPTGGGPASAGEELDRVLAVCDFGEQPGKYERHIGPLAGTAEVTVVCITPNAGLEQVTYATVPSFGYRPIGLVAMFLRALLESLLGSFDGVVSFSLLPHGCIALVVGRLAGIPVHLGIIGADVDVHARARYGPFIAVLLRRFDAVSVPGTAYARQLHRLGVGSSRVTVLTNPIDQRTYRPPDDDVEPSYDVLWVGRFSREKNPLLFVEAVSRVASDEPAVRAVMLGSGPLDGAVRSAIAERGLDGTIECPGWVDEPLDYYHRSRVFVLTSRRDALPLTLVEAMATGLACVVPDVGNIGDIAIDGENAVVVGEMTADRLASTIARLVNDDRRLAELGAAATRIRTAYSYERATRDWQRVLRLMAAP